MDQHYLGCHYYKPLQLLKVNWKTTDDRHKEQQINKQTKPKNYRRDNPCTNKGKLDTDHFVAGQHMETDRAASAKTMEMHNECNDVFTGIGCFKGTFSLQVSDDANPYHGTKMQGICPLETLQKKN